MTCHSLARSRAGVLGQVQQRYSGRSKSLVIGLTIATSFVGAREIVIGHGEDRYQLKLAAQKKLILTK